MLRIWGSDYTVQIAYESTGRFDDWILRNNIVIFHEMKFLFHTFLDKFDCNLCHKGSENYFPSCEVVCGRPRCSDRECNAKKSLGPCNCETKAITKTQLVYTQLETVTCATRALDVTQSSRGRIKKGKALYFRGAHIFPHLHFPRCSSGSSLWATHIGQTRL